MYYIEVLSQRFLWDFFLLLYMRCCTTKTVELCSVEFTFNQLVFETWHSDCLIWTLSWMLNVNSIYNPWWKANDAVGGFLLFSRLEIMHTSSHEFQRMRTHTSTHMMRIIHGPKENTLFLLLCYIKKFYLRNKKHTTWRRKTRRL